MSKQHFHDAMRQTGLDITTLQHYAYVAHHVPAFAAQRACLVGISSQSRQAPRRRRETRWLALAAEMFLDGNPLTLLRFSRSIQAGRLMSAKELEEARARRPRHRKHPPLREPHPGVLQGGCRDSGWLRTAGEHKRAALKRNIVQPIIDIYNQL